MIETGMPGRVFRMFGVLVIAAVIGWLAATEMWELVAGLLALVAVGVWSRWTGLGIAEGMILVLVSGSAGFNRDFARISVSVGSASIFITEILIALIACAVVFRLLRRNSMGLPPALLLSVGVFVAYGTYQVASGILDGYGIAALKDYSLFYYAALSVIVWLFADRRFETSVLKALSYGALAGGLYVTGKFLSSPEAIIRYGHVGHSSLALSAWLAILYLLPKVVLERQNRGKVLGMLGIAVLLGVIALSAYRTMALVIALSLLTGSFVALLNRELKAISVRLNRWLVMGITLLVAATLFGNTLSGAQGVFFEDLIQRFERLFYSGSLDNSAQFRLLVWSRAIEKIEESPIKGIGLGSSAVLYDDVYCSEASGADSNCGTAHNTFLTYLMRTGLLGFFLFLAVNAVVAHSVLRALRVARGEDAVRVWLLVTMLLSMLIYGMTSLLFESPYLAVQYWILLGVAQRASVRIGKTSLPGGTL